MGQYESVYAIMNTKVHLLALGLCAFGTFGALAQSGTTQTASPAQQHYGRGLGKLLTSEAERAKIDDLRFNIAPPPKPIQEAGPPQLHIDGITQRPDRPAGQRVTVWIDGRAYLENALPQGLKLVRAANGEVTGITSQIGKGKTEFAKIGDVITRPQTADEAQAAAQAIKDSQTKKQ